MDRLRQHAIDRKKSNVSRFFKLGVMSCLKFNK